MNIYEHQTAMPVRTATANSGGMARAKAIALEAAQTLSGTAWDAPLACAMTRSAMASIVVAAAPHLEVAAAVHFPWTWIGRRRWPPRRR